MVVNPLSNDIQYAATTKLIDLVEEASITGKRLLQEENFNQSGDIYYLLHALTYDDYFEVEQINNILEKLKIAANLYAVPVAPLVNEINPPTVNVGPQGPRGEKGDTGDTGPQGPQGEQGEPGQDGAGISLTEGKIYIGDIDGNPAEQTISGDITLSSSGVAAISSGVIVNDDINASAGIALTKLAAQTASRAAIFNSSGFAEPSAVTSAELGYLSGVSSSIQTQLNTKQAIITGAATTITSSDLAASRALISGTAGKVEVSTVTASELEYLSGATSNIQAQLDAKMTTDVSGVTTGDILFYDGTSWINLSIGSTNQVLTVSSGVPTWQNGVSNGLPTGGTANQYLIKSTSTDYETSWADLTVSAISDLSATADDLNLMAGLDGVITTTQLGYLAGVTSGIQSQLDSKQSSSLAYNAIWVGDGSNSATQLAPGSDGQVLMSVSGVPQWQTPSPPGDVSGEVSSTDNAIARWNGINGDAIQNSGVVIDDTDNITGVASLRTLNQGGIVLRELTASGTNAVTIRAHGTMASDYTITLPAAAPASNTFLKYDGTDYVWAIGGGGGGSALQQKTETGTTYTITDADDGYVIYFTNAAGCTVTMDDAVSIDIGVTTVRADGAGLISHTSDGTSVLFTIDDEYDIEHEKGAATWVKKSATDWYGWGSLGPSGSGSGGGTYTGTSNRITVNGSNEIDISSLYVGQTSITTLGTIATGTWQGTAIGTTYGGTGLTALGTASQLIRVNAAATGLEYFTPAYLTTNQTITMSGDVSGTGTTTITTTIGANTVSDSKFRQSAGLSVVGRSTNTTGNVADITAGTDAHVLRRSGTSIGFGTIGNASISDLAFSKLTSVTAFTYNGNTVASEKFIGTLDNFELPVRVNNTEVARFIADGIEIAGASEVEYTGNLIFSESGAEVLRFTNDGLQVTGASAIDYSTALTFTDNSTETHKFQGGVFRVGSASAPYTNYGTSTITFVDSDTSPVLGKYSGARRIYLDSTTIFRTNSVEFSTSGGSVDTTAASLTGSSGAITTGTSLRISSGSTAFTLGFQTTQGAGNIFGISGTWNPSSGANTFKSVSLTPTINTTGTYVGTAYGIDYNPTMTGTTGLTHYGLLIRDGYSGFGLASTLPTAVIDAAASTTARASLRLRSGTAPTTPNDGDIWFDGTALKIRISGVTRTVTVS